MALIEKLRTVRQMPDDTDLLAFFGLTPADTFGWDNEALRVGVESVPMNEAREALGLRPLPAPVPTRTVLIEDL